jgi:hypothetical protein
MNYASRIVLVFAPEILSGACGRNRMALTPRPEWTIKGVTQ